MIIEPHWSDDLEVSVRAGRILREHYPTPAAVLADGEKGLKKHRNCGWRTAHEIMETMAERGPTELQRKMALRQFSSAVLLDELVERGVLTRHVIYAQRDGSG